jgi:hypothetical protein
MRTAAARMILAGCTMFQLGCTIVTAQPNTGQTCGAGAGAGAGNSSVSGASGSSGAPGASGGSQSGGSTQTFGGWTNVTSNLIDLDTDCGNLATFAAKPDEDLLIAGVVKQGLWSSADGGGTWQHMGEGAGSDVIVNRPSSLVFDPTDSSRFWESGIYGAAAYVTTDDGQTLTQLGDAQHCDLVAVDFTDSARKTLLAGGHEQSKTLNLSTDSGMTWTSIGGSLPDNTNCTLPLIIDSTTYLVGCGGYGGGVTGIFRSTDSGSSWTSVSTFGGGRAPLRAADGTIYWPDPYPGGLARSEDDGKTWMQVADASTVLGYSPVELPDGRLAALNQQTVIVSADGGSSWQAATAQLPYGDSQGVAYSAQQKAFFVWHVTCDATSNHVPADAVMRAEFDYTKQ